MFHRVILWVISLVLCLQLQAQGISHAEPLATSYSLQQVPQKGEAFIKSNAVGLVLLVLNASYEYQFKENLSVNIPLYFSGWNYFSQNHKYRCLLTQPELRYWLSQPMGTFIGAHIGFGLYNWTTPSQEYRYQDEDGNTPFFNVGFSVGYRRALERTHRWFIEGSLGCGFVTTRYDRFLNQPNGKLVDTQTKNMFCIDQVNVSIVYRLENKKKGGGR